MLRSSSIRFLLKNFYKPKISIRNRAWEYEQYDAFPSVVLSDESQKDTILSGIFNSIVLNDITYWASWMLKKLTLGL